MWRVCALCLVWRLIVDVCGLVIVTCSSRACDIRRLMCVCLLVCGWLLRVVCCLVFAGCS